MSPKMSALEMQQPRALWLQLRWLVGMQPAHRRGTIRHDLGCYSA